MPTIPLSNVIPGAGRVVQSLPLGSPALGATTAVHAAIAQPASGTTVVTTAITNPAVARNLTITGNQSSCTGNVVIAGTDMEGQAISETIAAAGTSTVVGSKAFATVTSITIPTQGAGGDTIAIGTGAKLGLGVRLSRNSVVAAFLGGVREGTAPTVAFDSTNMYGNTVTLSSALAGTAVIIDYYGV
jgi:hypothetical protein